MGTVKKTKSLVTNSATEFAYAFQEATSASLDGAVGYCALASITVTTPAAGAFTAAATDICTKASHGFKTGLKVQVSSTTTLPAGLLASTDYFVIYLSSSTFKLASSLVNAIAGTAVDITDTGTGTHTITPTAIAGGVAKLQGSLDNSTFVDIGGSSTNITATGNVVWNVVDPMYDYVRIAYDMTAGQMSASSSITVKSDQ